MYAMPRPSNLMVFKIETPTEPLSAGSYGNGIERIVEDYYLLENEMRFKFKLINWAIIHALCVRAIFHPFSKKPEMPLPKIDNVRYRQ